MKRVIKKSVFSINIPHIHPKDIRIGNILSSNKNKVEVSSSNIADVISNIQQYAPIVLTEEILLKSGFKKEPESQKFYNDILEGYFVIFSGKIGILYKVDRGNISCPFRYVHDLQNIYYYITGKELVITIE